MLLLLLGQGLLLPDSPGINPNIRAELCAGSHLKTSLT